MRRKLGGRSAAEVRRRRAAEVKNDNGIFGVECFRPRQAKTLNRDSEKQNPRKFWQFHVNDHVTKQSNLHVFVCFSTTDKKFRKIDTDPTKFGDERESDEYS